MHPSAIEQAAELLRHAAASSQHLAELPQACRPATLADGYAIQARVAEQSGRQVAGWKVGIINAACPLAGRILSGHVVGSRLGFPLAGNRINMAEPEFAFLMARDLPARHQPYPLAEVLDAIAALHPAIEIPNSRYTDFTRVDSAQLAADAAYSAWLATGRAAPDGWRDLDLTTHEVQLWHNEARVQGSRLNVLGSPLLSLTWLANELHAYGEHLRAGQIVATGGCMPLVRVTAGDCLRADFGVIGVVETAFH